MRKNGILVVGSANMDLVASVQSFPRPGETVFGTAFAMYPGGKGANQAVCCAKLGADVQFVGRIGLDALGEKLIANLSREGVSLRYGFRDRRIHAGIALITVDACGQNEIIVVSGSNIKLTSSDIERRRDVFRSVRTVLLQLETPMATVLRAAQLARAAGCTVVLNPAPARKLPKSLLRLVDIITPNETEAEALTGIRVRDARSAEQAARTLSRSGVEAVVVTLGGRGCVLFHENHARHIPAVKVRAVDTTAAGDAFNGGLAVALAGGKSLEQSVRYAAAVAAFSVTRRGAQSSMPTHRQAAHLLSRKQ